MGRVALPRQLQTDELTLEIRSLLWGIVYAWLYANSTFNGARRVLDGSALQLARTWHVGALHQPLDEFKDNLSLWADSAKQLFYVPDFYPLFDFLEFLLQSSHFPDAHKEAIASTFEECRAGWRVQGEMLVPFATAEEAEAVAANLQHIEQSSNAGARAHLRKSAAALAAGQWADSARESISAVEAAARAIDDKKTLPDIVRELKVMGKPIHPALGRALTSVYGYASDEKGIRHSLVDEAEAAVGESEALLLYGVCAAFASYLARQIND